ncbi:MAG TPA: tetratricopeptide repeat protein, partial [Gemmatimonadales bacterium]|nr:tetratricopeptide repeat protein [Gemmatimonadales bacterium]
GPPQTRPEGSGAAWVWPLAVAAVALAASVTGLRNDLVQDDVSLLVESDRLHGAAPWRDFFTKPYWPPPHSPDLYRPLTSLLLAVEWVVGAGAPLGFRIASYLLYAAVAVGVLGLARRILPGGIARAVALIFAAHPLHVEAVALAVGQSELIVGLCAVLMTVRYLDCRRTGTGELGAGDWGLLALLYLVAALSKEHGLLLPGLLIAAELTLLHPAGRLGPRIRRLVPGYALLASLAGLLLLVRAVVLGGSVTGTFTASALQGLDFPGRALTMLAVVPHWTRLLLWPIQLQADYSPREIVASTGFGPAEGLGLGLILGAVVAAWLARRKAPTLAFGVLWAGIALLPVSNILVPTGIVLAERALFLPSMGCVLVVGGLLAVLPRWRRPPQPVPAIASRTLLAGVVVALAVRSAERQRVWRNDAEFRTRGVADAPRSWRTQLSYASLLFESRRRDSALERYRRALELAPPAERWRVRNDLAEHLFAEGENGPAVEALRASLRESPEQETTRHYLVLGLLALGAYREAAEQADSALARGASPALFGELRALADSARLLGVPPGGIRIRVRPMGK